MKDYRSPGLTRLPKVRFWRAPDFCHFPAKRRFLLLECQGDAPMGYFDRDYLFAFRGKFFGSGRFAPLEFVGGVPERIICPDTDDE